tara:strand:- start:8450 stop:9052 length:603 start_codon:yes stop_codon:yes gene_type:complete
MINTTDMSRAAALATSLMFAAPAAMAATTFDLTGSPASQASSFDYTVDGIGLEVTGFTDLVIGGITPTDVTRDETGLGVTRLLDSDPDLDGQVDEFLVFTFDQTVSLFTILFDDVDSDDDWDLFVDTGSGFTQVANDNTDNPFTFALGTDGNRVSIGADGRNDSFRVREITVAAVPLPAAGWLMLAGLGGIAALRRRKKA